MSTGTEKELFTINDFIKYHDSKLEKVSEEVKELNDDYKEKIKVKRDEFENSKFGKLEPLYDLIEDQKRHIKNMWVNLAATTAWTYFSSHVYDGIIKFASSETPQTSFYKGLAVGGGIIGGLALTINQYQRVQDDEQMIGDSMRSLFQEHEIKDKSGLERAKKTFQSYFKKYKTRLSTQPIMIGYS